jgi:Uma2 family endonuclease
MASVIQVTTVNYPESDGKPMGETDEHRDEMVRLIELLKRYYAGQRVYVSGDLLVFYEQGNPKKFIVPDVFVVKGIDPEKRRIYKIWYEGKPPDAIIEVTSRKTKKKDTVTKPALYGQLRVPEYFLFDLTRDYLEPPLQGHRLIGGRYDPIAADAQGGLVSEQLGLRLHAEGRQLMLSRLDTGQRLLTAEEELQIEAEARRAAEAEVARLREQLRPQDPT